MFEVQDLRFATLATVSRCGMVWFSEDVLTTEMIFENYLQKLRNVAVEEADEDFKPRGMAQILKVVINTFVLQGKPITEQNTVEIRDKRFVLLPSVEDFQHTRFKR